MPVSAAQGDCPHRSADVPSVSPGRNRKMMCRATGRHNPGRCRARPLAPPGTLGPRHGDRRRRRRVAARRVEPAIGRPRADETGASCDRLTRSHQRARQQDHCPATDTRGRHPVDHQIGAGRASRELKSRDDRSRIRLANAAPTVCSPWPRAISIKLRGRGLPALQSPEQANASMTASSSGSSRQRWMRAAASPAWTRSPRPARIRQQRQPQQHQCERRGQQPQQEGLQ